MDTLLPSKESKAIADALVEALYKDRIFEPHENGFKINSAAIKARVAEAVERSWQQGLNDAEVARRISLLRGNA